MNTITYTQIESMSKSALSEMVPFCYITQLGTTMKITKMSGTYFSNQDNIRKSFTDIKNEIMKKDSKVIKINELEKSLSNNKKSMSLIDIELHELNEKIDLLEKQKSKLGREITKIINEINDLKEKYNIKMYKPHEASFLENQDFVYISNAIDSYGNPLLKNKCKLLGLNLKRNKFTLLNNQQLIEIDVVYVFTLK